MIDETTEAGARAAARLRDEPIGWLTTVTPAGQPQSSPIWFLWEDGEILLQSLATTPRLRNIRANPRVSFTLDSDGVGGDILVIEGEARIADAELVPASAAAYRAKYDARIEANGWTWDSFRRDYPVVIRIRPTRVRTW
jgi:PPOX class probable F420-dependent enzyme